MVKVTKNGLFLYILSYYSYGVCWSFVAIKVKYIVKTFIILYKEFIVLIMVNKIFMVKLRVLRQSCEFIYNRSLKIYYKYNF